MDDRGASIVARGLSHQYGGDAGPLRVLADVCLTIPSGGYCSIQGRSGAGKTTLLSLLGGLVPPQSGELSVGGLDLSGLRRDALAAYRRSTVGFVFQDFGLLATLNALQNVELPATLAGRARSERQRRAIELLAAVGLRDRAGHLPARLSGGEHQRVAIARALVNRPRLLLADEPTGNLDRESGEQVLELLEEFHRRWGCTLVVVTHNTSLAERGPHRYVVERGRLFEVTAPVLQPEGMTP